MNISARTRKLQEKYSISIEDIMYIDLVHAGWNMPEAAYYAFKLAYPDDSKIRLWLSDKLKLTPGINRCLSDMEEEDKADKRKIRELKEKLDHKTGRINRDLAKQQEATEASLRSKQGMLEYLIELASTPGLDLRTKADLAKQITDLQNYKKEEIKELDNRINFYLPLTCKKCELYMNHSKRKDEDN